MPLYHTEAVSCMLYCTLGKLKSLSAHSGLKHKEVLLSSHSERRALEALICLLYSVSPTVDGVSVYSKMGTFYFPEIYV